MHSLCAIRDTIIGGIVGGIILLAVVAMCTLPVAMLWWGMAAILGAK